MKKEILFAILAGGLFGLIIAYGVFRINKSVAKTETPQVAQSSSPSPSPTLGDFKITVAEPESFDVITKTPQTVSGITKASSYIVTSAENGDYLSQVASNGEFSEDIKLNTGLNRISFFAFSNDGNFTQSDLPLIYSSEFAKYINSSTPESQQSTDEADSIRNKVQQQVEQALNQAKAFIGTITDIASSNLQIQSDSSEILQVSTNSDTSFVQVGTTNKEIKSSDVAIGDYIIAMGYKDTNGVLTADRVLIDSQPDDLGRIFTFGTVTTTSKSQISVTNPKIESEAQITTSASTHVYTFDEGKVGVSGLSKISEGDYIVAISTNTKSGKFARSIFIINILSTPGATPTPSTSE